MRARGFSLVETVIAALVLAIGVVALVGTESAASHLAATAQERSHAVEAAASALDRSLCPSPPGSLAVAVPIDVAIPVAAQHAVAVRAYLFCAGAP